MSEDALVAALNGLREEVKGMREDMSDVKDRVRDIELQQAEEKGKSEGSKDVLGRFLGACGVVGSVAGPFALYFLTHH